MQSASGGNPHIKALHRCKPRVNPHIKALHRFFDLFLINRQLSVFLEANSRVGFYLKTNF
ncbi:MAG: hypothetical protein F6K65_04610 [Moorea sp. SIO3C2]|nr:hypothetical protein [Moorena sp. SIO3C2]